MGQSELRLSRKKLLHNFNYFKKRLHPTTKIVAMIKANGYGLGDLEVANLLIEEGIDYLGVAYIREGIKLREGGIKLPIIIFTPGVANYCDLIKYNLEPAIVNRESFNSISEAVNKSEIESFPIHLNIDSGMQRVGFECTYLRELELALEGCSRIKVASLFTHLSSADEAQHDEFTREQIECFTQSANQISSLLGYSPLRHVLNSAGTERFTYAQMDMVRLGIGLYGISAVDSSLLKVPATFIAPVIHTKEVKEGSTVGYGRHGKVDKSVKRIATIPVGYADGIDRRLSRGNYSFLLNGKRVPIIGNVCMDAIMLDITGVDAKVGDEVILFGEELPPSLVAEKLDTITHEIYTSVSARVDRVVEE